jgi:hypothetical protein
MVGDDDHAVCLRDTELDALSDETRPSISKLGTKDLKR